MLPPEAGADAASFSPWPCPARPCPAWGLSGALESRSAELELYFDLVILLRLDPARRMERRRAREVGRGKSRVMAQQPWRRAGPCIAPAGGLWAGRRFMICQTLPDTGRRSRARHLAWTAGPKCPVMELDSAAPGLALRQAVVG